MSERYELGSPRVTINRLITQLEADPAPLAEGLARALAQTAAYANSVAPILLTVGHRVRGAASFGAQQAQAILDDMGTVPAANVTMMESLALWPSMGSN